MSRRTKVLTFVVAALAVSLPAGCTDLVVPAPELANETSMDTSPTTLRGRTFVYALDSGGVIQTSSEGLVSKTMTLRLFGGDPADRPRTGEMTLTSSNVSMVSLSARVAAEDAEALPFNGAASIRFLLSPAGSADGCGEGELLGKFELTFSSGTTAVEVEVVSLSEAALNAIHENDVVLCMEVKSNFAGVLTIREFSLTFTSAVNVATIALQNLDTSDIYLLLPGEVFMPSTQIAPGGVRIVTLDQPVTGYVIKVRAGRDFEVLDTALCPVVLSGMRYAGTVQWTGEALVCEAEQTVIEAEAEPVAVGTAHQVPLRNVEGVAVAADPTAKYNGVEYAILGVLSASTPDAPGGPTSDRLNVDLALLGLASVERIRIGTASSWAADLSDGVTAATLTFEFADDDGPVTLPLVLGETTSEWAYDRLEYAAIAGGVQHD